MQNWDSLQPANYDLNWYSNMFTGKNETHSSNLEQCFNIKQHSSMEINSPTSSPRNTDCQETNYLENNSIMPHNNNHPLGFNPLTPPGLPNAILPSMNFQSDISNDTERNESNEKLNENSLTPRNTPPVDVTPPKSPKGFDSNETLDRENDIISNSSEDTRFLESEDDEMIRVPIYNSHGKMKNYKCKHCGFTAITKISFWSHAKEHIKPEKMLQCPKCPFVTELKHHLEYHIRKHKNLKPFQCDKCNYSCVNKSMLNSHLKSHSSVYQYRCSDCDYATKYCHSFKLHLRKYEHKPGMVLDEDGTPNPSVVIDVYGTRRGPKMKSGRVRTKSEMKKEIQLESQTNHHSIDKSDNKQNFTKVNTKDQLISSQSNEKNIGNPVSGLLPNNFANMLHQTRNMSFLPYFNLNLQMIAAQQHAAWTQMSPQLQQTVFRQTENHNDDESRTKNLKDLKGSSDEEDNLEQKINPANIVIDLSQTFVNKEDNLLQNEKQQSSFNSKEDHNTPTITSSSSKRKTRVLKMDYEEPLENSNEDFEDTTQTNQNDSDDNDKKMNCSISETRNELPSSSQDDYKLINSTKLSSSTDRNATSHIMSQIPGIFECKYCDIYFKDAVLYTIHMGYHSCDDVFKCNMCGEKCDGPVGLFIHMARNAHS